MNIHRLILILVVLGAGWLQAEPLSTRPIQRPNILFIFSDDQRSDTIAALGNKNIRTPNLDRLVRQGTTFTRAYFMGGSLGAVCVSSRAMLMTGRSLFHAKDNLADQRLWPTQFGESGYQTFITGKWHNEQEGLLRGFDQGNAIFMGGMGNPYKLGLSKISGDHKLVAGLRPQGEHSVKLFADAAVDFISHAPTDKPWLCYFAPNCPHDPRVAPTAYHAEYNAHKPPIPANFLPLHPFDNGEMTIRDEQLAPWPRTPEVVRQHLADYYSYVTFMDDQIGRVLTALKASGQYENTIIVFSSDNGLAIGSHGLFGKQNLYDHSTHQPLIMSGPGIKKGKKVDALCYLFDIYPTLAELAGVEPLKESEGRSLVPLLKGSSKEHREAIFTAYRNLQRAVRDDRWKLIAYPPINKMQLFDLKSDPFEMKDLAADPAHARELAKMIEKLRQEQLSFGDSLQLTSEHPAPSEFDFSRIKRDKNAKPLE